MITSSNYGISLLRFARMSEPDTIKIMHCRPTVWTWRALSLEFARRHEGFGGMPIASFFRVVDISFEYRGDAVP
jgi:hypothetical protein